MKIDKYISALSYDVKKLSIPTVAALNAMHALEHDVKRKEKVIINNIHHAIGNDVFRAAIIHAAIYGGIRLPGLQKALERERSLCSLMSVLPVEFLEGCQLESISTATLDGLYMNIVEGRDMNEVFAPYRKRDGNI